MKPDNKLTRGEANHNPGNIVYNPANDWVGQTGIEPRCAGGPPPRFACFDTPINGGRAIAVLLQTYQAKGFRTVRSLIERWAPPSENDSAGYVAAVARAVRVDPDAEIDVKDYRIMRPLLEAIIFQENGRAIYSAAQIDEMLRRGGVTKPGAAEIPLPPTKPPVKSAGLAAASTIAAPGVGLATIASDPALRDAVQASGIPWLAIAVSLLGIAATAYLLWHALRNRKTEAAT